MDENCRSMILSEDYYDLILYEAELRVGRTSNLEEGYCIQNLANDFGILYIAGSGLPPLNYENYLYADVPLLYSPVQDMIHQDSAVVGNEFSIQNRVPEPDYEALMDSGILEMQESALALKGRGVLFGYIDTGIDYQNPVFRYSDGSSRIASIWDQTVQSGTSPDLFDYGSEYSTEVINQALFSINPYEVVPSRDELGHGSAMAGVQAAPEAAIAMVKLKPAKQYLRDFYCVKADAVAYSEADILTGLKYLDNLADRLDMPLVIALGLGTNLGDHNGNSILAGYCNSLLDKNGRAIVIAGGNEGNARHHYFGEMRRTETENNGGSDNVSSVEIRVSEDDRQFMLEFWGGRPDIYSIDIRSPGGEMVPRIQARKSSSEQYRFLYESTTVKVDYVVGETLTGAELIMVSFLNPTPGIWTIGIYADGNGISTLLSESVLRSFHIWLPISGFISENTYFLQPNPDVTLTEPAYASSTLSVSTYQNSNDSFYIRSGRGYSRTGRKKPDLSSPGVDISTVGGERTASCMAAAIAGGALAQYMEGAVVRGNEPSFRMTDMKYYLYRGADRDSQLAYPNRLWGYGRLNIKGAFDAMRALL